LVKEPTQECSFLIIVPLSRQSKIALLIQLHLNNLLILHCNMKFSETLIKWYNANKRDLPWRKTSDPYKVWLSEIILQQTRVDQGMDYYHKFISLFPTIFDLSAASEDKILKAWQGLGYYSRARNISYTARFIVGELGGKFPKTQRELLKLKGIGKYTSAAIASFCFSEKTAAVDGNVMRVLSRIFGIEEPIDSVIGQKTLQELADELISRKQPGTFNQAIMEFGALQCTPHKPNCTDCPFHSICVAFKEEKVNILPIKGKKTIVKNIWIYYFFIQYGKKTYLRQRKDSGIWKGLFDLPGIECNEKMDMKQVVDSFSKQFAMSKKLDILQESEEYIHILSHRKIRARFITCKISNQWKTKSDQIFEVSLKDIDEYAVPRLIERFLEKRPDTFC